MAAPCRCLYATGDKCSARSTCSCPRAWTSWRGKACARRCGGQSRRSPPPLTKREKEVVALLVSGASTRQIAEQTGLTVATVHTYLKRIYSKLGVHSRVELVARMVGTVGSVPPPAGSEVDDDDLLDDDIVSDSL